ncbi:hypothetical protein NKDENANG_01203 [Candidatus Entotheonellaceae bacterium PAL068K]
MWIQRLSGNPIIRPHMDARMGTNINGPSLIRVPDWLANPLGAYYLYFADHKGSYIRLAYADRLEGPWQTQAPGSLQLEQSHFLTAAPEVPEALQPQLDAMAKQRAGMIGIETAIENATAPHIASPDAHVLDETRQIRLYYHGLEGVRQQVSRVATSTDGIHFQAAPEVLRRPYMRMFRYRGGYYGMAMPGVFYRSDDGLTHFEAGPTRFNPNMRHAGLLRRDDRLYVFWTQVGDIPERILVSTIDLEPDWMAWKASEPIEVLRPAHPLGRQRGTAPSLGQRRYQSARQSAP